MEFELNLEKDWSEVEKPPVAKVVIECVMESNQDIPDKKYNNAQMIVRNKYKIHISYINFDILGKVFSYGSSLSRWNNCIPPTLSIGNIDKANTTIPIPPNHCSNDLHKSIPLGKLSRPIITVEPVVVTPLIDSKNEFVKVSWVSQYINGIAENKEIDIQDKTVRRKACLISIFFIGLLKEKIKIIPIIKVKMLETKKTCQSLWPYARSIIIGKFIAKDVKQSKTPMT